MAPDDLQLDIDDRDLLIDNAAEEALALDLDDRDFALDPADGEIVADFGDTGVPGPRGAKGDQGEPGRDGEGIVVTYSPPSAQATWLVPHGIGRPPVVNVVLPDGESVGFRVVHLDAATVSIEFAFATNGTAYLQ